MVERPNNRTLLIRFLLILFCSAFVALGFSSVAMHGFFLDWLPTAVDLTGAAGIGLAAGYFTRILLSNRRGFLRTMVAVGGTIWGLLVFGWMTGWQFGIGPLYYNPSTVDWAGFALLLLGCCCALTAGLAYKKPPHSTSRANTTQSIARQPASAELTVARKARQIDRKPVSKGKEPKTTRKRASSNVKKDARISKPAAIRSPGKPNRGSAVKQKRPSRKIVLALLEEHRCPYCLEIVKRNDARGVVECEVCHTLHHADCWAITGTCQVPHYNH